MKVRMLLLGAAIASAVAIVPAAEAATTSCAYSPATNEQLVDSVNVASTSMTGSSLLLPATGDYHVISGGTWENASHGLVDTAYNSGDAFNWDNSQQGWAGIGPNWGEL